MTKDLIYETLTQDKIDMLAHKQEMTKHEIQSMTDSEINLRYESLTSMLTERQNLLNEVKTTKCIADEHLQQSTEALLKGISEAHELGINDPALAPLISKSKVITTNWKAINKQIESLELEIIEINNDRNLIKLK
ncbi:MAG: hypothetical protein J6N72_06635 [Psychrobacter sp.]|nr:hypothetical protein [Psychrobacter sp.]